jgi:hypothetical protein
MPRDYKTNQSRPVFNDCITMPPHAENNPLQDTAVRIPPYAVWQLLQSYTSHARTEAYLYIAQFICDVHCMDSLC